MASIVQSFGEVDDLDEEESEGSLDGAGPSGDGVPKSKKILAEAFSAPNKKQASKHALINQAAAASKALSEISKKINARMMEGEVASNPVDRIAEINARFTQLNAPLSGEVIPVVENDKIRGYKCEVDINDYPQYVRWKITTRDVFQSVQENNSVSLTNRGVYIPPSKANVSVGAGEKRLHLLIESDAELNVHRAKRDLLQVIVEATQEALSRGPVESLKYSVL